MGQNRKYRLVEWKRVSQGEASEDINKLSSLQDKMNKVVEKEGLFYSIEEVKD